MKNYILILLLILPAIICIVNGTGKSYAYDKVTAIDDVIDEEADEEDGSVANEEADEVDGTVTNDDDEDVLDGDDDNDDAVEDDSEQLGINSNSSSNADVLLIFPQLPYARGEQIRLPANRSIEVLAGFRNIGPNDLIVKSIEATLRDPIDFNYYLQNFTVTEYNTTIPPGFEVTLAYKFFSPDQYDGLAFMNIILLYRDTNGVLYKDTVFNESIFINEVYEEMDGETFFLYLMMAGIIGLLIYYIGQKHLLRLFTRRRSSHSKKIETGTENMDNSNKIDYEWLPAETLRALKNNIAPVKITRRNKKKSHKQRKQKKAQVIRMSETEEDDDELLYRTYK